MKNFASLCALLSLTSLLVPLAPACSNSSSAPGGDGGLPPATDSGAEAGGGDGAASCAPVAPASGSVPTFTAPALGQGVCNATSISAFVAACGASTGSTAKCATYAQSVASSACGQCLFSKNSTIAPVETVTVGGQVVIKTGARAHLRVVAIDHGDGAKATQHLSLALADTTSITGHRLSVSTSAHEFAGPTVKGDAVKRAGVGGAIGAAGGFVVGHLFHHGGAGAAAGAGTGAVAGAVTAKAGPVKIAAETAMNFQLTHAATTRGAGDSPAN